MLKKLFLIFVCSLLVLPSIVFAPCAPPYFPVDFSYPSGILTEGQSYSIEATNPRDLTANITICVKLVGGDFGFSESYLVEPNQTIIKTFVAPSIDFLSTLNFCFIDYNFGREIREDVLVTPLLTLLPNSPSFQFLFNAILFIASLMLSFFLGYLVAKRSQDNS